VDDNPSSDEGVKTSSVRIESDSSSSSSSGTSLSSGSHMDLSNDRFLGIY
jgi:hypothetical protein